MEGKVMNEINNKKERGDEVFVKGSDEFLSRRRALRDAGKMALFAGAVYMGLGLPGVSVQQKAEACCPCSTGCAFSCGGVCDYSCSGGCQNGCEGVCEDSCSGSCEGECDITCSGGCSEPCMDD